MQYFYEATKFFIFVLTIIWTIQLNRPGDISDMNPITIKYSNDIINRNKNIDDKTDKRHIKDILFINGCYKKLPHPHRYRVLHQMEQLNARFLESDECFYLDFDPFKVCDYRIIIFYRCPWTQNVGEAIKLAKTLNKKVLFDIDDLIIDTKYTETIPYLKTLSPKEKFIYDRGVKRIGRTLKLCEGAITTTEALAKELKNYVPNVFINRNVASEEMWKLSKIALINKENSKKNKKVIIGYFSGSITHNSDLEMIWPALRQILNEFKNVQLFLAGELTFQKILNEFPDKILYKKFLDWRKLPELISNVDINLAPIENTIFNAAKSENKWVEASLVKIPTVASNFGAFKHVIHNNETGLLCTNINDWYISLKALIINEQLRKKIGENAYNFCKRKYNTIQTGIKLANFINSFVNKHIGFFIPKLNNCGGIYVILKHATILQDEGWDVDLILPSTKKNLFEFEGHIFNTISFNDSIITSQYDIIVATFYSTLFTILNYYRTKKHLYLVQNYETNFYPRGKYFRGVAEKTYSAQFGVEYITISKWCKRWLWNKYRKNARYAPNGIDFDNIKYYRRELNKKKIRILIEGDSSSYYKNVDESFKIIEKLDKNNFEVWYLSNNGKPKNWYQFDKFFNKISFEKVQQIYYQCDVLIKSSFLESFSYPPLEMMATGGFCIVVPNGGNKEYLKDGKNCLFYKLGEIDDAIKRLKQLIADKNLQNHLYENGIETAKKRNWKKFKSQILSLYYA